MKTENSSRTEVEKNYKAHQENPGPAPEAFEEKGDEGSGRFLFVILGIIVLILVIAWIFF